MTRGSLIGLLGVVLLAGGCASTPGPYTSQSQSVRDSLRAQALTQQAAELIDSDPSQAESLLREALNADLYHGPAHNNLGVIHLNHGDLYSAASEFEWARKLMPGHPDPRLNLGVALERAGKIDQAMDSYHTALDVYPNHLPTIQALVRCQVRHNHVDEQTAGWLDEITLRGDERWQDWARLERLRLGDP